MSGRAIDLARVGGLLLAGGRSRRFGAEKAVAPFANGVMMDAVAERFAGFAHRAVSARPHSAAQARARLTNTPVLHDDPTLPSGPLTGVLAGLQWARGLDLRFLATAPCDAPLLPPTLFARLLEGVVNADAAFAVTSSGQHPLCAIWSVTLAAPIEAALHSGEHPPVRAFLASRRAHGVFFEDAHAFANANTKAALCALERSP